jgi:hypothetical protein
MIHLVYQIKNKYICYLMKNRVLIYKMYHLYSNKIALAYRTIYDIL